MFSVCLAFVAFILGIVLILYRIESRRKAEILDRQVTQREQLQNNVRDLETSLHAQWFRSWFKETRIDPRSGVGQSKNFDLIKYAEKRPPYGLDVHHELVAIKARLDCVEDDIAKNVPVFKDFMQVRCRCGCEYQTKLRESHCPKCQSRIRV